MQSRLKFLAASCLALAAAALSAALPVRAAVHPAASPVDVAGRPIPVVAHPRIVSVDPALTEILYAIGAGGDLVADSDYCDYPSAARKLPHVGALQRLEVEKIVALRPSLVVVVPGSHDLWRSVEHLARAPVFVAEDGSVSAIDDNIAALGRLTGHQAEAGALVRKIQAHLAAIRAKVARGPRPRVFYMVWNDPLQTAAPSSYLGELIADAGGRDIAPSGAGLYPRMSWETLLVDRPAIVLGPQDLAAAVRQAGRKVGARKTVVLDDDILSRPGPRVVEAVDLLYKAIH